MPIRNNQPLPVQPPAEPEPEAQVAGCLARIAVLDGSLRAFTSTCPESALAAACSASTLGGALRGIPVAIKDVIDVEGLPTSANSLSASAAPASRDAEVVRRLRSHGAVIVGKTTTWEFAVGPNPPDGPFSRARNPNGETYQTGGSSSGSAVAVASGEAVGALGTDTGGSIRCPASWCGVVGFKPTHGVVPTEGVLPLAPSLDCIGTLASNVAVAASLFDAIAGVGDASRNPARVIAELDSARPLEGYYIAIWREALDACDPSAEVLYNFDRITKQLATAGATICDVQLPSLAVFNAACYLIARHESFLCYRERLSDQTWRGSLGAPARSLLLSGGMISSEEIGRTVALRARLTAAADRALAMCDAVVTPSMGTVALPVEVGAGIMASPVPHFTRFASLTGQPSITIPSGRSANGLPFGVLLNGARGEDRKLLHLATLVEGVLARAAEAARGTEGAT
jgi:aspartyl-tRNA(Asn)/glutamyl-tRNA(Gln) amidotransferase subunit A